MKFAVRYYTITGNTKKLATAIADAIGVVAEDTSTPLADDVDVVFLGSSVYAGGVAKEVTAFVNSLNPAVTVVNFSTAALVKSTLKQISKLLAKRGIALYEKDFACRGQFKGVHKGKPDQEDMQNAAAFAKQVVQELNKK